MTPAQVAAVRLGEEPRVWVSGREVGVDVAGSAVCRVPRREGCGSELLRAYVWIAELAGLDPYDAQRALWRYGYEDRP